MAGSYIQANRPEHARPLLEQVVNDYPTAAGASEAKQMLAKIGD